jgi:hypothetical protein
LYSEASTSLKIFSKSLNIFQKGSNYFKKASILPKESIKSLAIFKIASH